MQRLGQRQATTKMSESSIRFNADNPEQQIQEALDDKVIVLFQPGRLGGVAIDASYFREHPELPDDAA